jgi:hypothetical protein
VPDQRNSEITAETRGKHGLWIYYRNAEGPTRRPWLEHVSMSSPAQDAWRLIFKAVAARWNANLTDAQRLAWRTFTERYPRHDQLSQTYAPSGQSRHAGCNAISYCYAGAVLDDPPADLHCHQPTLLEILTATATPQALSIRMTGTLDADEYWVLTAAPLTNVGKSNVNNLWRPLDFDDDALPHTENAIAAYTANFSALVAGKKIHVRFQIANVATGTISQPITASATVT